MLRSVTLGIAFSFLTAGCALVELPGPAGIFMIQGEVSNLTPRPVELQVRTEAGVLPDGVQPALLPAHTTANVTFYLPINGQWSIDVDHVNLISSVERSAKAIRQGCTLEIELTADGFPYGCDLFP